MLTGKQKRYLRKQAHELRPIFQIGKQGVNENLLKQLADVLEKRELIKVSILQNCLEDKQDVAEQINEGIAAEIVQIIGRNIVLYKESIENKQLELP